MPTSKSSDEEEPASPTTTRQYEPLRSGLDQSAEGTVRRPRPIATATTSYGTITTSESALDRTSSNADRTRQPGARTQGPAADASPSTSRPRMPPRRSTSKYQTPHRGQEFSVDDDLLDVQSDAQQRAKQKTSSSQTIRRRNAGPGPLAKIDSVEEVEDGRKEQRASSKARSLPAINTSRVEDDEDELETANDDEEEDTSGADTAVQPIPDRREIADEDEDEDEDDGGLSDAESFTLKDRQQAINQTHPFGIRIWKPALYKKNRSVEKNAEGDIHSTPGGYVSHWIRLFNLTWTLIFGWWLALITAVAALVCLFFSIPVADFGYSRVLFGLAGYLFYPFGKFVKLKQDESYADEDEGEGRSISEYEQWQSGDIEDGRLFFGPSASASRSLVGRRRESLESADENDSLLSYSRTGGRPPRAQTQQTKRRLFGRGKWTIGRVGFYFVFYLFVTPIMLLVSFLCWLMVFYIPMGRITWILWTHVRRHPLALSFHRDAKFARSPTDEPASILLCTYRAAGTKYWKYTIDGTNIFLINLLAIVVFTIIDYFVFDEWLHLDIWITNTGLVFTLALFSIMPLAYFIGQAVASISAQSSMGLGAAINAFFSTIVEVFLYCVALNQGKGQLVEGSIVGSLFAGLLLLPGLSMCFGAIHRKTQRFNVKSAGVTSTMLLFAVIAAFGPTLFYKIYGSHELTCRACRRSGHHSADEDCQRCFFSQTPAVNDRFFVEAVRPYCWFAAIMLFLSYIIGLLFTLRTHAAVIWNEAPDGSKLQASTILPGSSLAQSQVGFPSRHDKERDRERDRDRNIADSAATVTGRTPIMDDQLYQRVLGQSLKQMGIGDAPDQARPEPSKAQDEDVGSKQSSTHIVPPRDELEPLKSIDGLSDEQNSQLMKQMAQLAATAATFAARDSTLRPRRSRVPSHIGTIRTGGTTAVIMSPEAHHDEHLHSNVAAAAAAAAAAVADPHAAAQAQANGGGHDAPNWGAVKSYVILIGATLLYAIIAEILVNTVDVVLQGEGGFSINEKFLGITLFSLVPNTTEFLNAISFAMNGNIALSMEIGSAYALQVCLLQIPALVLFSAVHGRFLDSEDLASHTFNLIFPQWDMVTVILCVFLLSYVYGEGKSNYFKGSILVLTYLVILVGFWQAGLSFDMDSSGVNRFETWTNVNGHRTFKTVGQFGSGEAF